MPRIARVVIPGVPHHLVQRGHRRQRVFFCDEDRELYLRLLKTYGDKEGIAYWAYCLMENHVHLVAVPAFPDSFKRGLGIAHWKYSLIINMREGWKGYLWQSRFFSHPLDDPYQRAAVRYAELNPVRAGIVKRAQDYAWSSARAHVIQKSNLLLSESPLDHEVKDWSEFLASGITDSELKLIRQHSTTGRPLGDEAFIQKLEAITGRRLRLKKPGPKPNR